ncbi:copper resistance protein CopD, partial [Acinetobacter baumannii]
AALIPMGTQGHAGTEASHTAAVTSLVLHILAAAVWLGGLILLVVVRPAMTRPQLQTAMLRYSSIALVAFVVVAISGTVRAS